MSRKKNPKKLLTALRSSKTKNSEASPSSVRAKVRSLGLTEKDVDAAIRWARSH